jgi:hypothetical protein
MEQMFMNTIIAASGLTAAACIVLIYHTVMLTRVSRLAVATADLAAALSPGTQISAYKVRCKIANVQHLSRKLQQTK